MKSPTKKKRTKSISAIILIYLKELKNCHQSFKAPPFLDEILEKRNIFYDVPLLEKILFKLEQGDLIRRIDGVSYLKDDSKNYPSKPFDIQDLSSFAKTLHLYEITSEGIIFCNEKSKISKKLLLKLIQFMIKYFGYFGFLNEIFDLLHGYLFINSKNGMISFSQN